MRPVGKSILRSGELLILGAAVLYSFYPIVSVCALPEAHPAFIVGQIFVFLYTALLWTASIVVWLRA